MNDMNENSINIRDVDIENDKIRKKFIDDIQNFMSEFSDPLAETKEAVVSSAFSGFALEAVEGEERLGIAVITRSPYNRFQPKYHLAYIAISPNARGKGIGKKLLKAIIARSEGSIALHVGVNNENAIAFYEKMGWETKYLRMMPADNHNKS